MRSRLMVSVVVGATLTIGLVGCASSKASTSAAAPPTATAASGSGSCSYPASGTAAKNVGTPPTAGVSHTDSSETIVTSQGSITIKLNAAAAPCTVNSFVYLASKGYFNGTSCHRLTTAGIFVLQCGDPTGTGSGGPGYSFADENLTGATYPAATVAMANAGPNTNGSQFFLVYQDTTLAPSYTPFGTITSGLDVVTKVAAAGTADGSSDGKPKLSVNITSVTP